MGRGTRIFWLGFEYLWKWGQVFLYSYKNQSLQGLERNLSFFFRFFTLYSKGGEIISRALPEEKKILILEIWSRSRSATPEICEIQFCIQNIILWEEKMPFKFF
jgi:hypothetical protein